MSMTATRPTAPQERTTPASLVGQWMDFIRAMEDHCGAAVRQTDAEVRAVAEQVAAFGIQPATSSAAHEGLIPTAR